MRVLYALSVLLTTLILSPWAAFRAYLVCMEEGFRLFFDVLTDDE
jgi:hypothetical protein